MTVFNSKGRYERLAIVVHVFQNQQNLIVSRCCFAADGQEMYQHSQRTCIAMVLFCSFALLFGDVLDGVAAVICLISILLTGRRLQMVTPQWSLVSIVSEQHLCGHQDKRKKHSLIGNEPPDNRVTLGFKNLVTDLYLCMEL